MLSIQSCYNNLFSCCFIPEPDVWFGIPALRAQSTKGYSCIRQFDVTYRGITVSVKYWTQGQNFCLYEVVRSPDQRLDGDTYSGPVSKDTRTIYTTGLQKKIEQVYANHSQFHLCARIEQQAITYREVKGSYLGCIPAMRWIIVSSPKGILNGEIIERYDTTLDSVRLACMEGLVAQLTESSQLQPELWF